MTEVISPNNLVNYQAGAVVSRELIKKAGGTVTVFAFAEGEGLSEHAAPYDALVYVLEGKAKITIGGNPFAVQAGEMIMMPSNEPHALQAEERFKMLLVMVKV